MQIDPSKHYCQDGEWYIPSVNGRREFYVYWGRMVQKTMLWLGFINLIGSVLAAYALRLSIDEPAIGLWTKSLIAVAVVIVFILALMAVMTAHRMGVDRQRHEVRHRVHYPDLEHDELPTRIQRDDGVGQSSPTD